MKFTVISDSHGSFQAWKKAEKYFDKSDMVLHAGDLLYHGARNPLPAEYDTIQIMESINKSDYNMLFVKGNVDALIDDWVLPYPLPEYSVVQDNDRRIVIYHGYQHQTEEERFEFAKRFDADILIFGHIHTPLIKEKDGIILLNPGSIALPKQNPAVPTIATIDESKIHILNLDTGEQLKEYVL